MKLTRLLLGVFAVLRLGRLIAWDNLTSPLRVAIGRKAAGDTSFWYFLAELVNCKHCVGVWAAGLVSIFVAKPSPLGDAVLIWLGLAGAQSYLETPQTGD